jgi:hypothetical protein
LTLVKAAGGAPGQKSQKLHCDGPEGIMSQSQETQPAADAPLRIPFMQRVLDNPFLLLFIGVVIPTVLYILWGVMELVQIPLIDTVK